jgi:hypothetical protein
MPNPSEPIEIDCDAPAYLIVHACQSLGFHSPLDVRWCRMSHVPRRKGVDMDGRRGIGLWQWLFSKGLPTWKACVCGKPLPTLDLYSFTLFSDLTTDIHLGQCRKCRTIFWEKY